MVDPERSNIIFNGERNLPQRGVFASSTLTAVEWEIANAVVNWEDPKRFNQDLFDVTGRSLFYRSPDYPNLGLDDMLKRKYSGLQIIGAGGSPRGLRKGIYSPIGEKITIYPVNPTNSSADVDLSDILQQRKIDEDGNLVLWRREYSPFYGMDFKESSARKKVTELFNRVADASPPEWEYPFVTPLLVAEGHFPEKTDDKGLPLQFQVYRVPVQPRFPSQLMNTILNNGRDAALGSLFKFSLLAGKSHRIMHSIYLAYGDNHPNNMSLIEGSKIDAIYMTDLGSCTDFTGSKYPKRYIGLDFLMFMQSNERFFRHLIPYTSEKKITGDEKEEKSVFNATAAWGFTCGYFQEEINRTLPNDFSWRDFSVEAYKETKIILEGFFKLNYQQFIEFMEKYLSEVGINPNIS